MKELNLEETSLKINWKGYSHVMRVPNNQEILQMQEMKDDEEETFERLVKFYVHLGLPEDFVKSMEPGHLAQIMEGLSEGKES